MSPEDVKVTTRVLIGLVFITLAIGGGCVADTFVRATACYNILASKDIPDMAKAQLLQSGACMALRPH